MTEHRVGNTNAKDPRGGRYGKQYKRATTRFIRRNRREECERQRQDG